MAAFYWLVEGFWFFALVVFLVLPRQQGQLAGLASPRALVLAYLSDCGPGFALVVFPCGSFSEALDFYDFGIFTCLGAGMAD